MPPSILLICTDQQRYDALGASGNPHILTPNLDRLALDGVRFDACYVQAPVCAPSRASLMTGRYPHSHGVWANGVDIAPSERFFTRTLADAGYDCGLAGKLHLGAAKNGRIEPRIDDGFRVFRWAHDPYTTSPENHYHAWLRAHHPGVLEATLISGADAFDRLPTQQHYSHWLAQETIDFLTTGREPDRPFCFIANFFDPHHGFGAPAEYRARYEAARLPGPVGSEQELATKPAVLTDYSKKSYAGTSPGFREYTADQIQDIRAEYYAMVTLIDDEVGRILATLDEQGLTDNTMVIFTSDHGELLGDHQMLLKGPMMFDCSIRVPLILRWPGQLPAGAVRTGLVQWIDLAPTLLEAAETAPLLEAAETDPLPGAQGKSLLALARDGDRQGPRDWALSEYRNSGQPDDPPVHTTMLRRGDWKVVVHHGQPATTRQRDGEMYDLARDPDELVNLWDQPDCRDVRWEMASLLLDVLVATEDRSQPRINDY